MRNAPESRNPLQDVVTGARAVGLGLALGLIVYAADEAEIALQEPRATDAPTPATVVTATVPAEPVYLPSRPKANPLAPVPIYLHSESKSVAPTAEPIPTF